jgi:hypothetical protein
MRYRFVTLSLLFWYLFCPDPVKAQFDPQGWGWKATVTPYPRAASTVALTLDGSIYDRLLTPPHDLRLVNQSGVQVPHVIQCGRTTAATTVVTRPVQLINRTYMPHRFSRVVLDFGESVVKNKIMVELSGQNYRRRVTIEGGNDGMSWETIAENLFLFDIQTPGQWHRVDTLAFAENSFRYLRVTVENMTDDPERVEIYSASAFYEEPVGEPQLKPLEIINRNIEQEKKTSSTLITLDLGFRHLPLQTVAVDIEDPLFHRAYAIEGRNTITHKNYRRAEEAWRAEEVETPWSSVFQGTFYRRQDQGKVSEVTEATIPHASYRYLRITIRNGDDSPLSIRDIRVKGRICALLFQAQPGTPYLLYGGNGKAGAPSYDFGRLVPGMDISSLPQVGHGNIETLHPPEAKIPWSERYWYVITGGVIVAVVLMLWIILPVLEKEMKSGQES